MPTTRAFIREMRREEHLPQRHATLLNIAHTPLSSIIRHLQCIEMLDNCPALQRLNRQDGVGVRCPNTGPLSMLDSMSSKGSRSPILVGF